VPEWARHLLCYRLGLFRDNGDFRVAARLKDQAGKVGWIFLWLLGVPIPILVILFLVRGCT
jgi:hypothetical protein